MENINDFIAIRDRVIERYELLKSSGLLPVKVFDAIIDSRSIDESLENLRNNRFIVSVCGQIKAGKSMLLNDLVFSSEVLPTADTPETAKITEISYGEKSEYEVFFYTPDEWEELKNSPVTDNGRSGTYYDIVIKPAVDEITRITGKSVNDAEILGRGKIHGTDLADLEKFISVKGIFTMLVKSIQIKYPSELLKKITIVDTPGINDPNVFRSRITEKWIGRSDAVIFLLSAAQPFTAQDRDFFEKYLLPVPVEKVMMAISKIDLADDMSQIKNFVSRSVRQVLGTTGEALFEGRDPLLVAPMFSLFSKLREDHDCGRMNLPPERLEEIKYQLGERARSSATIGDIAKNKGFMEGFAAELEKRLISGSGAAIVESHLRKIEAVYEYHTKNREAELKGLEEKMAAAAAEEKAASNELSSASTERDNYQLISEGVTAEVDRISSYYQSSAEPFFKNICEDLSKKLSGAPCKQLEANLAFEAYSAIEAGVAVMNSEFGAMIDNFRSKMPAIAASVVSASNSEKGGSIMAIVKSATDQIFNETDVTRVLADVKRAVDSELSPDALAKLESYWLFFWLDEKASKKNFEERLSKALVTDGSIRAAFLAGVQPAANAVKTKVGQLFFRIKARLEELKKVSGELDARISRAREERGKLMAVAKVRIAEIGELSKGRDAVRAAIE